jgi:cell division protein FtsX
VKGLSLLAVAVFLCILGLLVFATQQLSSLADSVSDIQEDTASIAQDVSDIDDAVSSLTGALTSPPPGSGSQPQ